MIKKKTVFVLGAGASMPYGHWSGAQLTARIQEQHNQDVPTIAHELSVHAGVPVEEARDFVRAFFKSRIGSIDNFLSRRPEFLGPGKFAIAYYLCACENVDSVIRLGIEDDWYQLLWERLIADIEKPDQLHFSNVRFVTFNYDRSLELSLHEATKNTFGIDDARAQNAWSQIPILHVYGQLGEFGPILQDRQRPYSAHISQQSLSIAANGIQIMPETREDSEIFRKVRKWFDWADQICFLGFGFDSLNVKRLGLNSVLEHKKERATPLPQIYASVVGKVAAEVDGIMGSLYGSVPVQDWYPLASQNRMVLRSTRILE